MIRILLSAVILLVAALPAPASATELTVANGKLVGAKGVPIGGSKYDVAFKDGACIGIFGSCDATTHFTFDQAGAELAASALLSEVLLDGSSGTFDSDPALTFGCSYEVNCNIWTPTSVSNGVLSGVNTTNFLNALNDHSGGGFSAPSTYDSATEINGDFIVFAFWSPSAVPEAAIWAMMIVGFGMVGGAIRRRARAVAFH